jgi:Xaa-Pro dipeptidase
MNRFEWLQKNMRDFNLDVVVLRLPENVVALSGYWPRNGFSFVVVPSQGNPCLIVPDGDESAAVSGSISEVRTFGWSRLADGDPYLSVAKLLHEFVQTKGMKSNCKVGVEKAFNQASPSLCAGEMLLPGITTLELISGAFKTNDLVPIDPVMDEIRLIKNDADVERICIANHAAKSALKVFETWIVPGVSEIALASRIEAEVAMLSTNYRGGASSGRAWAQVSSGERTTHSYYPGVVSTNRVIRDGDFVMIELAVVVDGYWSDLTRTFLCGPKSEMQWSMLHIVQRAQMSAIESIHDCVSAQYVDQVARDVIEQAGYGPYFVHHTGHGVGFRYHEAAPFIAPGSHDRLKAGMIVTVEPGIYIPGIGGVRIEDNILVQSSGARILG